MATFKRRAVGFGQTETDTNHSLSQRQSVLEESPFVLQTGGARTQQYIQYIRALNTQFTSWVEKQLKEHPHELWQEGIQDYLRHALKIQEDFKDVVDSCTSGRKVTVPQLQATPTLQSNLADQSGKSISDTSFYSQALPLPVVNPFSTSYSSGMPKLNIPYQPTNNGNELQEDDDGPPEPSSPSLKRSEEPGVQLVYEIKCKLYIKGEPNSDKAWKELGMGNLTLKSREGVEKGTKDAKATVVVRNEVGRILLNALLYPNMKMNVQKNTVTGIFHSAEADVKIETEEGHRETDATKGRLYLFKLRTASDAEQLGDVLTSNAPKG